MARKPKSRNANGSGTIRQRKDGSWEARVTVGRDEETGKQIQKSLYAGTKDEVSRKLRELTAEIDNGTYVLPKQITVGEWLDIWVEEYTVNVTDHTRDLYRSYIRTHIKPGIGAVRLTSLSLEQVQRFYNSLSRKEKALSPKTVQNIHGALHKALSQAVRFGYIKINPASNAMLPRIYAPELTPLTDGQLLEFIHAIKGHPHEDLYLVDLFTGMRRSEIIGLTWDCVDFDKGIITIKRQLAPLKDGSRQCRFTPTKNGKSRIIAPAQAVMDILTRCREKQRVQEENAGELWDNPEGFVFTDDIGHHLSHMTVYNRFKKIVRSIGLPDVRLHDLRHSYAVASLQAGDDIKTLQENLGHHTAAFTLNVYGHVSMQMKRESSRRMNIFMENLLNS